MYRPEQQSEGVEGSRHPRVTLHYGRTRVQCAAMDKHTNIRDEKAYIK